MSKRVQTYEGDGITVTFDPNVCTHSGVCVRGLPVVFDVRRPRWIDLKGVDAGTVAAQIDRCPSGALRYERTSGAGRA
jgi:uncharacterized Fe-S cluster protein YjdI